METEEELGKGLRERKDIKAEEEKRRAAVYEVWKETMIRGKDAEVKEHTELIEEQLFDVSQRLYDVETTFTALFQVVNMEKRELIQHGQAFAYQQGILDIVEELRDYASGERSLTEEITDMKKTVIKGVVKVEKEETGGLYQ